MKLASHIFRNALWAAVLCSTVASDGLGELRYRIGTPLSFDPPPDRLLVLHGYLVGMVRQSPILQILPTGSPPDSFAVKVALPRPIVSTVGANRGVLVACADGTVWRVDPGSRETEELLPGDGRGQFLYLDDRVLIERSSLLEILIHDLADSARRRSRVGVENATGPAFRVGGWVVVRLRDGSFQAIDLEVPTEPVLGEKLQIESLDSAVPFEDRLLIFGRETVSIARIVSPGTLDIVAERPGLGHVSRALRCGDAVLVRTLQGLQLYRMDGSCEDIKGVGSGTEFDLLASDGTTHWVRIRKGALVPLEPDPGLSPEPRAVLPTRHTAMSCAALDSLLLVASGLEGVVVHRLRPDGRLAKIATVFLPGFARYIAARDTHAFVTDDRQGLFALDLSKDGTPTLIPSDQELPLLRRLVALPNRRALAASDRQLFLFRLDEADQLRLVSRVPAGGLVYGVAEYPSGFLVLTSTGQSCSITFYDLSHGNMADFVLRESEGLSSFVTDETGHAWALRNHVEIGRVQFDGPGVASFGSVFRLPSPVAALDVGHGIFVAGSGEILYGSRVRGPGPVRNVVFDDEDVDPVPMIWREDVYVPAGRKGTLVYSLDVFR